MDETASVRRVINTDAGNCRTNISDAIAGLIASSAIAHEITASTLGATGQVALVFF